MSCAIVSVIYGVPLNREVSEKISEWEDTGDERWTDECGFEMLYSASGNYHVGYCGVELCQLRPYSDQLVSELLLKPTQAQMDEAKQLVDALEPELRALAGDLDVYLVWSDS